MDNTSGFSDKGAELLKKEKDSVPRCCVGCVRWEKFGRKCWYYWEGKKHCSMLITTWEEGVQQQPF